jgi:CubicO group peptidase (beta-lactamase class C family)
MKRFTAILLACAATAILAAPPANTVDAGKAGMDAARLSNISERMRQYVNQGLVSGVVTLVQRHGAIAQLEAVGYQDMEKKTPMKTDTIFEVMSMTKPITAVAIMMLMEEGKLALTDPVQKHLPEFRGQMMIAERGKDTVTMKKPSRPITIRDLLTHTSGLAEMPPEGMEGVTFYYKMNRTLAEAVTMYSQMPLQFEPGTQWSYSNPGIATLGRIIEVVGDQPYERFLEERIFKPLGMKDSFFFPTPERYSRIASVYQADKGKLVNLGDGIYRKGAKYPMPEGGLFSTATDLAEFYQMMLNKGTGHGKRLISPASVEVMTSVHTPGLSQTWGLGWNVASKASDMLPLVSPGTFSHGGAFGTYGFVDPKKDLVGVFLIQRMGGGAEPALNSFLTMAESAITN